MEKKTVQINPEIHQKLKIRATKNKSTIQSELNQILENELEKDKNE